MNSLEASVVIVARGEPADLARALSALRAQTVTRDAFEVIVAGTGPGIDAVVAEGARGAPALQRVPAGRGGAAARNAGRRAAGAPLVAFTDDRCEASRGWLAAGLAGARSDPGTFVQGPTVPHPAERSRLGPFSHTLERNTLGPWFEAVNVFYPRELLERVGGFDEGAYGDTDGDATDLAWRAIELGMTPVWAENALMYHAISDLGALGKLRLTWRSQGTVLTLKRHPRLRRHCAGRVFCTEPHRWLVRAALAALLPARLRWLRWWLAAPYVARLFPPRQPAAWAPYVLLHDLVDFIACARDRLRHRLLLL